MNCSQGTRPLQIDSSKVAAKFICTCLSGTVRAINNDEYTCKKLEYDPRGVPDSSSIVMAGLAHTRQIILIKTMKERVTSISRYRRDCVG